MPVFNCCPTVLKFYLLLINILLLSLALLCLIVTIVIEMRWIDDSEINELDTYRDIGTYTFVVAVMQLIITVYCMAAIYLDYKPFYTTAMVTLIILGILELVMYFKAFKYVSSKESEVIIKNFLNKLYSKAFGEYKDYVFFIHQKNKCCGLHGPFDSFMSAYNNTMKFCCSERVKVCTRTKAFKKGCLQALNDFYSTATKAVRVGLQIMGILQGFCLILCFILRHSVGTVTEEVWNLAK